MRVLITGGAGFIGSHLAEACLHRGNEVSILDDLSTGSLHNLDGIRDHPRFRCTIDRVQNRPVTTELVDRADVIFHLAASVGVKRVMDSPLETIGNNLHASEIVFAAAAAKGKRVLYTSTSEVYGLSTDFPYRENGTLVLGAPSKGRWSYACSKAMDEYLGLSYLHERGLPISIVRLFNTVGPRQTGHYGMVIPTLVKQALGGEPLTVFGDGSQRRCFGYVGDVVQALVKVMDHPRAPGQIFNIGSTQEISILELAQRIKAITGSDSGIVTIPYSIAYQAGYEDMPRRVPDVSRIRALIGYNPTTTIDRIIGSVADSFLAETRIPAAFEAALAVA